MPSETSDQVWLLLTVCSLLLGPQEFTPLEIQTDAFKNSLFLFQVKCCSLSWGSGTEHPIEACSWNCFCSHQTGFARIASGLGRFDSSYTVMQHCISGLQNVLSNSVPWADFLVVCHDVLVKWQGKDNLFNNAALGYLRGKITAAHVSLMQVFCGFLWITELLTPPAG